MLLRYSYFPKMEKYFRVCVTHHMAVSCLIVGTFRAVALTKENAKRTRYGEKRLRKLASTHRLEMIDDLGSGITEKTLRDSGERVIVDMKFTVYKVTLDKDAIDVHLKLDDEFLEGKWSTIEESKKLKLTPPTIELFKRLGYI